MDIKRANEELLLLQGEIEALLFFAGRIDERLTETRGYYLKVNRRLVDLQKQVIKDLGDNDALLNQKGAEKNDDTAEHSEGMFDLQGGLLRKPEDVEAFGGESHGSDLSRLSARAESEGTAELPPRLAPEQEQVSRLLQFTLNKEDAENLLDLVEINYAEVLKAKNCSGSDDCHELAADLHKLHDNLRAAIVRAINAEEANADGRND